MAEKMRKGNRNSSRTLANFPQGLWEQCGEQYRGLRTRINYAFNSEKHKVILVTSAIAGEGKTTTAVNLSRSLAMASRKVLLVDGDMRKPKIHSLFAVNNTYGLKDLILEEDAPMEKSAKTNITGLDILLSGTKTENPTELLLSDRADDFFEKNRFFYDYVVVDAPPVLPVTDAVVMSKWADGILLVVGYGQTPREVVKEAIGELQGGNLLGLVMNRIPATRQYYNYYGYY